MENINRLCVSAYVKGQAALKAAGQKVRDRARQVVEDESGMEIIAIVLILVIVVALVVIFRKNIMALINAAWDKIFNPESTPNPTATKGDTSNGGLF